MTAFVPAGNERVKDLGLFGKLREGQKRRVAEAKQAAEDSARAAGASMQEIAEAGDAAANKEHRRNLRRVGGS